MKQGGKLYFTEDQYRYARYEVNAAEYARRRGYSLVKDGRNYRMREHDSMVFTPDGRWFWNSRALRGRAIEFVMHYEGKTLPEAVLALCNADGQTYQDAAPPATAPVPEKKEFALPPRAKSCRRLFGYLCATRKLDRDIVAELVRKGDLYESTRPYVAQSTGRTAQAHNAVFVGRTITGEARSAFQRGLSSFSGRTAFRRDVAGSDPSAPFCLAGRTGVTTVFVFEAAIDAISHASIFKAAGLDYRWCDRIALGGTEKGIGLLTYLKERPQILSVVLALDEDEAGQIATERLEALIPADQYKVSRARQNVGKDWNEYLQVWHSVLQSRSRPLAPGAAGQIYFLDDRNDVAAIDSYRDPALLCSAVTSYLLTGEKIVVAARAPQEKQRKRENVTMASQYKEIAALAQEAELKKKSQRLNELNAMLNLDKPEDQIIDEAEDSAQKRRAPDNDQLAEAARLMIQRAGSAAELDAGLEP